MRYCDFWGDARGSRYLSLRRFGSCGVRRVSVGRLHDADVIAKRLEISARVLNGLILFGEVRCYHLHRSRLNQARDVFALDQYAAFTTPDHIDESLGCDYRTLGAAPISGSLRVNENVGRARLKVVGLRFEPVEVLAADLLTASFEIVRSKEMDVPLDVDGVCGCQKFREGLTEPMAPVGFVVEFSILVQSQLVRRRVQGCRADVA